MARLLYLSQARFPTEKAHGLQIMQNCEAFADEGYEVELWVSSRLNTAAMKAITDSFAHYGVQQNFVIRRVPCLDLYWLTFGNLQVQKITFMIATLTYIFFVLIRLPFQRTDIIYSRDEYTLFALTFFFPQDKLAFEIHQFWRGRVSQRIQRRVVQKVKNIVAITPKLKEDLIEVHGVDSSQIIVAHDGIRAERFQNQLEQKEARQKIGWSEDTFIVGFVGRLQMLNMDKGVGTLIDALAQVENASIALVGGPDDAVQILREKWLSHGLPENRFLYAGQVAPDAVPMYLSAFDVCAMPHPFTPQFAYYTSPLKLFEYMASGRAIVASDLPGWADVVQHEETALLFPAGDIQALADAIQRLKDNPDLRERLGKNAHERVFQHYTWSARAKHIRNHLARDTIS